MLAESGVKGHKMDSCLTENTAVKKGPLLACHVVIKMPDGSRGEHKGFYYHRLDALDRAMELFPDAKVISVCGGKARMAAV